MSGSVDPGASARTRVALVSGASGVLGRAYCLALAARGFAVVANARGRYRYGDSCGLERVANEVMAAGGTVLVVRGDVSTAAGSEHVIRTALKAFGGIDVLVNNSGVPKDRTLARMTEQDFDEVVRCHLYSTFHLTRSAWRPLIASRCGRIINTVSSSGLWGNPGQSNYAAAKMGVLGFTLSLALEGARLGVNVNAVAPFAATAATARLIPQPLREAFRPEQVAALVAWLADAGCGANGEIFEAGGGYLRKVVLTAGSGTAFADVPTPEEVAQCLAQADPPAGVHTPANARLAVAEFLEAALAVTGQEAGG
ncbi:SDR family NAD(P)-dependent oxidoreductase [Streptomyces boncukensis]|uniref:SDR family NAD(P)-dependent oxidoreductase n=1 Tax=Streptomyces boncukensis TaxID=2711219 RepID=A0A6G4X316_9ACTN|nr:SDR family NAD(P)-dependent oxidoreductase [Streptomyces boncukensis]NGO71778.1 SDR family NAD(P)-dependent oxidoreductase [Streptomyces boncukensis]